MLALFILQGFQTAQGLLVGLLNIYTLENHCTSWRGGGGGGGRGEGYSDIFIHR